MSLWQKLTDWLCALVDWILVLPLHAGLERLTLKRVIYFGALVIAAIALARIGSFDFVYVLTGDTILYFEIASALMFFAARGYARQMLHLVAQRIRAAVKCATVFVMRYGGIVRQRRNANALRRKNSSGRGKRSDDEPTVCGRPVRSAFA